MSEPETSNEFAISIDGQTVNVRFWPRRFADYGQFEFTSPEKGRRNPTSETGYKSHFSPMWEVEEAPGIEDYAQALGNALARQPGRPDEDSEAAEPQAQLALF